MLNPLDHTGKTILVTGASGGIGSQVCLSLSRLGARVILVGRRTDTLEETLKTLDGTGHVIRGFDLLEAERIQGWLRETATTTGPLDGLVHCAGRQLTQALRFLRPDDVNDFLSLDIRTGLCLAKGLRQNGVHATTSSLVFLSSVMGLVGHPGKGLYSAAKGALIAMTRSLALELAPEGIRVNVVAGGYAPTDTTRRMENAQTPEQLATLTERHPLGIGSPRDIANAVAFLTGDTGRWITGTTVTVDGGYTAQ